MTKHLDPKKLLIGVKKEVNNDAKTDPKTVDNIVKKIHDSADEKEKKTLPSAETRRTTFDIPKDVHKRIQIRAVEQEMTMKDYLVGLAIKDLEQ